MTTKAFKQSLLIASLAIVAAAAISGCSSSTTPTTTTTTNVTPKTGSTFTYNKHEVDSSATTGRTSGDTTVVAIVVSSGGTYNGKSNVTTMYDDFDTLRYQVESNNDVSVYRSKFGSGGFLFNNPSPWMTLPFGSKLNGVQLFTYDTTITVSGLSEKLTVAGTADYIGADEIDTGWAHVKFVSGLQAKITISIVGTTPVPINITSTQTYSFDYNKIGNYFHSISNTIFPNVKFLGTTVLPGNTSFAEKLLTSFSLK